MVEETEQEKIASALAVNPQASLRDLEVATGIGKNRISKMMEKMGWKKIGEKWQPDKNLIQ
jgi:hypothetical protein